MLPFSRLSLLAVVIALSACGGGSSGGGAPSAVQPGESSGTPEPGQPAGGESGSHASGAMDSKIDGVSFDSASFDFSEQTGIARVTVNRSGDISQPATIQFTTSDRTALAGEDYASETGSLTWAAGDGESKTIDIQLIISAQSESVEQLSVELTDISGAQYGDFSSALVNVIDYQAECQPWSSYYVESPLTVSAGCYKVDKTIVVRRGGELALEAGARLEFADNEMMEIESDGLLIAAGTAQNPVVFTGQRAENGYWTGLFIRSLAESALEHVIVEYAGFGFDDSNISVSFAGAARFKSVLSRFSEGYGIRISEDAQISEFVSNRLTRNQSYPVAVGSNNAYVLDRTSIYTGNRTLDGQGRDAIALLDRSIRKDQEWEDVGVHYQTSTLGLELYSRLHILGGTTVVFRADTSFRIENTGELIVGSSAGPLVVFTGLEQIQGYWRGVEVYSGRENIIDNTVIEYAGSDAGYFEAAVGVNSHDGKLKLRNSLIQHSEGDGFSVGAQSSVEISNLTSTFNNRPGRVSVREVNSLSSNSDFSGNTVDRIFVTGNSLDRNNDQTFKAINVPYRIDKTTVNGPISLQSSVVIEAGVVIEFGLNAGFNIDVDGSLKAVGTPEKPILFTAAQKVRGGWNGFQYTFSGDPDNQIDHAIFEYGGESQGNTHALLGYFGSDVRGSVTNTIFRESLTNGLILSGMVTEAGNTFEGIQLQAIVDNR